MRRFFLLMLPLAVLLSAPLACSDIDIDDDPVETPDDPEDVPDEEPWEAGVQVKVTLDSNAPGGNTRVVRYITGETMGEEPSWVPSYSGHIFGGWYYDKECTKPVDYENDIVKREMTLYAYFAKEIVLKDGGKVARVTGNRIYGEEFVSPNSTGTKYNVGCTDLGVIWEMSDAKTYGVLFGDTFGNDFKVGSGGPNGASDWRSNVLAYSTETDFSKGLVFSGMLMDKKKALRAESVIIRENYYAFTYIPTAAISVNGKEYMHYMYWEVGDRTRVTQNYSSYAVSSDCGKTWSNCKNQIKFTYSSNFNMVGLAKKDGDPYCYILGCQNGNGYRASTAKLGRFLPENILDKTKYEFWNGDKKQWYKGLEGMATTLIAGNVGELSLMYMENMKAWLVMYLNPASGICYKSAARITGPWSQERVLCGFSSYPAAYGSYIHPYCAKAENTSGEIYWTMSQWAPYNVFLMKATVQ